jgi:hypothetical protein
MRKLSSLPLEPMLALALASATTSATASPMFVATGPIKGNACKGFVIEWCRTYRIDGVKGKDGKLYTVKTEYDTVDEYNEQSKLCWIRTKSKGAGWLSLGINAVWQPVFVTKTDSGTYEELDVEYLVFSCAKRQ